MLTGCWQDRGDPPDDERQDCSKHVEDYYWNKLTLNPLMWKIWWAPNNASKWQMGFNSAFKGLIENSASSWFLLYGYTRDYSLSQSKHHVPWIIIFFPAMKFLEAHLTLNEVMITLWATENESRFRELQADKKSYASFSRIVCQAGTVYIFTWWKKSVTICTILPHTLILTRTLLHLP